MPRNPLTPNFGQIPYFIAGRETLIEEITDAFENGYGHPSLTSLLVGARGTGKTALLSYLADTAQQFGWIAVNVACVDGMLEDVLQQTSLAASEFVETAERKRLKGFSIAQAISLEWENEHGQKPNWRSQMSALLDQLANRDIGLLITIDEVDPRLSDMVHLASNYQLFIREERKVALLMAGLPSRIDKMLDNKSISFLRRASRYELNRIADYEVEQAFEKTAESAGKSFSIDGLARAVSAAEGFPYMIQLVGFRSWQEAKEAKTIDLASVETGSGLAAKDMEHRVLQASLRELSPGDIRFLRAMLDDTDESSVADLENRLGESSGYVAQYRRRLIDRGLIGPRGRGRLGFDLPGLRDYLPKFPG